MSPAGLRRIRPRTHDGQRQAMRPTESRQPPPKNQVLLSSIHLRVFAFSISVFRLLSLSCPLVLSNILDSARSSSYFRDPRFAAKKPNLRGSIRASAGRNTGEIYEAWRCCPLSPYARGETPHKLQAGCRCEVRATLVI